MLALLRHNNSFVIKIKPNIRHDAQHWAQRVLYTRSCLLKNLKNQYVIKTQFQAYALQLFQLQSHYVRNGNEH